MSNKGKLILAVACVLLSAVLLIISAVLKDNAVINLALATTFIAISLALMFGAIFFAAKVDYETGLYECRKCGHKFKPTFKAYIWGVHTLTKRHLKCPECKEKSWCKRKKIG